MQFMSVNFTGHLKCRNFDPHPSNRTLIKIPTATPYAVGYGPAIGRSIEGEKISGGAARDQQVRSVPTPVLTGSTSLLGHRLRW